jgi:hypothetical protein
VTAGSGKMGTGTSWKSFAEFDCCLEAKANKSSHGFQRTKQFAVWRPGTCKKPMVGLSIVLVGLSIMLVGLFIVLVGLASSCVRVVTRHAFKGGGSGYQKDFPKKKRGGSLFFFRWPPEKLNLQSSRQTTSRNHHCKEKRKKKCHGP